MCRTVLIEHGGEAFDDGLDDNSAADNKKTHRSIVLHLLLLFMMV